MPKVGQGDEACHHRCPQCRSVVNVRLKSFVWGLIISGTHCCITNHLKARWLLSDPLFLGSLLCHCIQMASGPGVAWKAPLGSWLEWSLPCPCGPRASPFPMACPQSHQQGSPTSCLWLRAHKNSHSGREEAVPMRHFKNKPGLAWCNSHCIVLVN